MRPEFMLADTLPVLNELINGQRVGVRISPWRMP